MPASVAPTPFDPEPNAHAEHVCAARRHTVHNGDAEIRPWHWTRLLQRCDRMASANQDVACGVTLQRAGAIGAFGVTGDGNDAVARPSRMTAVLGIGGGLVKVVTAISACGGVINNFVHGCVQSRMRERERPDQPVARRWRVSSATIEELATAAMFGLATGDGNPILQNPLGEGGRDEVKLAVAHAVQAGLWLGPNTPVNLRPTSPVRRAERCSALRPAARRPGKRSCGALLVRLVGGRVENRCRQSRTTDQPSLPVRLRR